MPHKKAKKSIRDESVKQRGYDNPPSAPGFSPASIKSSDALAPKPSNKRRNRIKKAQDGSNLDSFGGRKDLGGLSKSAHRIFNAETVREEYRASKKRKLEEGEKGINKNSKKSITPLPYESIGAFNRRVEVELRPGIDKAIKASKSSTLKAKAARLKKVKGQLENENEEAKLLNAKDGQSVKNGNTRATPQDSIDPFVPPEKLERGRTGMTEFAPASQRKSVNDVVDAPPVLKKAKRGLESVSYFDTPLPSSRVPISMQQQKILTLEREKAIVMYRELKAAREVEQRIDHGKI